MSKWGLIFFLGWMCGTCFVVFVLPPQVEQVEVASPCPSGWPEQHPCCLHYDDVMARGVCGAEDAAGWKRCVLTWYQKIDPDAAGPENKHLKIKQK